MFIRSAAADRGLHQSRAIQEANKKWGDGRWAGRETIGIQVCKKKYAPFNFTVVEEQPGNNTAASKSGNNAAGCSTTRPRRVVKVERMFGCPHHSKLRKRVIQKHGERPGWEPFGQWSMKKAQELARRETRRLNGDLGVEDESTIVTMDDDDEEAATMAGNSTVPSSAAMVCVPSSAATSTAAAAVSSSSSNEELRTMCHNGRCAWKLKSKYDDVYEEILEESSSNKTKRRRM